MASEVDICNLALGKLGNPGSVSSINPPDQSVEAQYCANYYPIALSELLDKHSWSFATRRQKLVQVTNSSKQYGFAFAVPSDLISIINVMYGDRYPVLEYALEVEEIAGVQTQVIRCHYEDVYLLYTSNTTTVSMFPPLFVEALINTLAYYLAGPMIKGDVGVAAQKSILQNLIRASVNQAILSDIKNYKTNFQRLGYSPEGISMRTRWQGADYYG